MAKYAEGTTVSVADSKQEIERTIKRYGGDMVSFGWGNERTAVIGFRHSERFVRIEVSLPGIEDPEFAKQGFRDSTPAEKQKRFDMEEKRRWRVALLRIKAKLELVQDGTPFSEEFMPYLMLPEGGTVKSQIMSRIDEEYQTGHTPSLDFNAPRFVALPEGRTE